MLVYMFDQGSPDSRRAELRGGKGAGLAELVSLGMPVPPGATLTTEACCLFAENSNVPHALEVELQAALRTIEVRTGLTFGSPSVPLLLSVRSGAPVSMPGMLDTVLNIGLNDNTVLGLAAVHGEVFAWDCYRRFLQMYGSIVLDVSRALFEKAAIGFDLSAVGDLQKLCFSYQKLIADRSAVGVPFHPYDQLKMAIGAVIGSWKGERAQSFRNAENISHHGGTAVNIQAMVFGNCDALSGTGVVFSADPASGATGLSGEYLPQAQGEDVVSGVLSPLPLQHLALSQPAVYAELKGRVEMLADYYNDILDIEFTVQSGKLYLLQCRPAKRTTLAGAVFAVAQVKAEYWTREQALASVSGSGVVRLHRPAFSAPALAEALSTPERLIVRGRPASPGCVTGTLTFDTGRANTLYFSDKPVILARLDTTPDDLPLLLKATGLVTAVGGTTSHAAVVARSRGIAAVVGANFCIDKSDVENLRLWNGERFFCEGEMVSLDGENGVLLSGEIPLEAAAITPAVETFLCWLAERAGLSVPQPVDLSWATERHSVNQWLNDFYLSSSLADACQGTVLEQRGRALHDGIACQLASLILCYLLYTVAGEIGFFLYEDQARGRLFEPWRILEDDFGVRVRTIQMHGVNVAAVVAKVAAAPLAEQERFFHTCAQTFAAEGHWGPDFGGEPWRKIAAAAAAYLAGEMSRDVFIDHVFDLRHHGGNRFDNHVMTSYKTRERIIVEQLEVKKDATTVGALYVRLIALYKCSQAVTELFDEGHGLGLWSRYLV